MRARDDGRRTRHNKKLHREHKNSEVETEIGGDTVRKPTEECVAYWEEMLRRHGLSERSIDARDGPDHKLGFYGSGSELDKMATRLEIESIDHRVKPGKWTMDKQWNEPQ